MSDCTGKPIDCVLYRDYDGTCEKDDGPCCLLDGSGRTRNKEIDRLRAELAKALVNAAAVEQKYKAEVERLSQLAESRLQQAAVAEEQVERLRALCADRPKNTCGEFDSWLEQIDAAGRGEGRE